MSVFDQLGQVAMQAQEKGLISRQVAERICRIGADRLHYKHLGLELHGLMAQLVPAGGKLPASSIEALVEQIEEKHRRI
ncbi:MAG: hypothetical protein FDZ69_01820 [Deltaproteobacteria bacterium]|nr:MAG: hypothetical protein FDZ69_01820 [Deltaproteobacteria bacterium]